MQRATAGLGSRSDLLDALDLLSDGGLSRKRPGLTGYLLLLLGRVSSEPLKAYRMVHLTIQVGVSKAAVVCAGRGGMMSPSACDLTAVA